MTGRLLPVGVFVCLLRETLWWPHESRLAVSRPRVWEGSLLARKEVLAPYPAQARGEDTPVVAALLRGYRVALLDTAQNFDAADSGHHEIEYHDVGLILVYELESVLAVVYDGGLQVALFQPFGECLDELLFVIDQQYLRR